jgi:serine/threonine protein kinase
MSLIDLIRKILVKDVQKRIGYGENGYADIKKHPFFEDIDWEAISMKPIAELISLLEDQKVEAERIYFLKQLKNPRSV